MVVGRSQILIVSNIPTSHLYEVSIKYIQNILLAKQNEFYYTIIRQPLLQVWLKLSFGNHFGPTILNSDTIFQWQHEQVTHDLILFFLS